MIKRWYLVIFTFLFLSTTVSCDLIPIGQEPEADLVLMPVEDAVVIAEANLVPAKYSSLRFALPGKVAEIFVTEGEEVEEGQVLALLGNVESLEAQLLAADLEVIKAEQRLKEAKRYYTNNDSIDLAEAALDLAKGQQRAALRALDDAILAGFEPLEAQLLAADLAVTEAEQKLEELETYSVDQDLIDLAEAALDAAKGQQLAAQKALDDARNTGLEPLEAQLLAADMEVMKAEKLLQELKRYTTDQDVIDLAEASLDTAKGRQRAAQRALDDARNASFEPLEAQLLAADLAVMEAEQKLEELKNYSIDQDAIDLAEASLDTAKGRQRAAQRALDDARNAGFDPLDAQILSTNLAVEEAEQKLRELERQRRDQDDIKLSQAAYSMAKGQQWAARKALEEDVKLAAPFAGKVVRIELKEGVYTSPAEVAMVLADSTAWYLETFDLTENEVVRISEGGQVEILFDALPGQNFTGEVESISEYFIERFGNVTYMVRISLAEKDERLRWGMTAEVRFIE